MSSSASPRGALAGQAGANIGRLGWLVAGAVAGAAALAVAQRSPRASALARTNFRGHSVSLAGGPALAAAASLTAATSAAAAGRGPAAAAALVAGVGSGLVGRYDDVVGARPGQQAKGFRGHLAALRSGQITSGLVKVVGVGAAGLAGSALLAADSARLSADSGHPRRGWAHTVVDVLLGAGVIAGTANLVNLLDLRPGRAIKAGLLIGAPLLAGESGPLVAGPVGAAAATLPADLGEQVMLGDCGANAIGAVLGVGLAARTGTLGRAGLLAGLAALTAASEKVSFTSVIERTPGLRELDGFGRSTSAPPRDTRRHH